MFTDAIEVELVNCHFFQVLSIECRRLVATKVMEVSTAIKNLYRATTTEHSHSHRDTHQPAVAALFLLETGGSSRPMRSKLIALLFWSFSGCMVSIGRRVTLTEGTEVVEGLWNGPFL